MNIIGNVLKEERLKNNLTIEELSNISNISISTISKLENNKIRDINNAFLYRICNILKLDYESILRLKWDLFPTFFNERNHKFAGK